MFKYTKYQGGIMKKKYFLLIVVTAILFSFQTALAEDRMDYTNEASKLNAMGLFNGTQNGYELDRVPTRVESAAMLVRLLGAEQEANEKKYEHPFTDVPEWADAIVGYMYEKGYTKGLGNNLFGSSQTTIARDYTTFMLRSLGYGDSDFSYLEALNFAVSNGILTQEEAVNLQEIEFKRNEMVLISYRTLNANLKASETTLAKKLYDNGIIKNLETSEQVMSNAIETSITGIDSSSDILEANSNEVYIYAEKKDIKNGRVTGFDLESKEYFTEGYAGSLCFKKGFTEWNGLNINYELSFYNEGQFVKKIYYMNHIYNAENDRWTDFITPFDKFDEIKISAHPLENDEVTSELDSIFKIVSTMDSKILKDTISEYGNVHAAAYESSKIDFNSNDDINAIAWRIIYSGTSIYDDGNVFRPNANKYIIDGNFTLEFQDEGSCIDAKRIISLPKNNMTERVNLILIFNEGFKVEKAYFVE
jgi:hypothetical protein